MQPEMRLRFPGERPGPGRNQLWVGQPGAAPSVSSSPAPEEEAVAAPAGPEAIEEPEATQITVQQQGPAPVASDDASGYAGRAGVLYQVYRKRGKTPEEAAHLIERHRNVLESEWTNQVQRYLAYAATLEGGAIGPDGRVKAWNKLTDREHILKGFLASLGLSPAQVERRAAQASYLLGPAGPEDLVTWLKYLHSHGPSMFDADGFLKQPGTFSRGRNNLISGVVYDDGVSGKAAEARVEQEDQRAAKARRPAEADQGGVWQVPPGEIPDEFWGDVDAETGLEGGVQKPGAATIGQEGIDYEFLPTDTPGGPAEAAYPVTREQAEARCKRECEKKKAAAERRRKVGRTLNAIIYGSRRANEMIPVPGPGGQRQYTMPDPDIPETALQLDDYWKTTRYEEDLAKAREEYERCMQAACSPTCPP